MTKSVSFEGKNYDFPDDASDAEIGAAIQSSTASPSFSTVVGAIPGEARRQLSSAVAGADIAIGDVVGSETMRKRGLGVKQQIAEEAALERPKNMGIVDEGVLQGGASMLTQLPAMGVAALAAPVAAPLALLGAATTSMGLTTGLSKYGDERQAGFQPGRSAMHAMIEGLIEKYTEYLPLKELVGGNALVRQARNFLVKEFAGEQLATLGQDINAKLSDQPDMTLGDYFRDALVTAVATPVAGGAQLAVMKAGQLGAQALATSPDAPSQPVPSTVPADPTTPEPSVGTPSVTPPFAGAVSPPLPATPVAAAPAIQPASVPQAQSTVRVYYAGENEHFFEATLNALEAKAVTEQVRYADLPIEELAALQEKVVETARLDFDGTERFPLPKDASFAWKTAVEPTPAIASKSIDSEPTYTHGVDSPSPAPVYAQNTVAINAENVKAKAIQFPDAVTTALWNYGSALTRYETTTKPADSKKLNALRDKAKELSGITDDALIAEQAQRYVYGVTLTGLRKAKGKLYTAPALETALSAQKSHEDKVSSGLASKVKPGEAAISADLPFGDPWIKTMQVYLQAWVKTFSPNMKVVILGVQSGTDTRARTWYYGGTHYIYVPQEQNKVLALYVLAHEFGHMIVSEHVNDPRYTKEKDTLIQEYTDLVTKTEGLTAGQFVKNFTSPIDVIAQDYDPMMTAAQHIEHIGPASLTFDEWMADQMVRYMHTKQTHLTEPGGTFWKDLFAKLKGFFEKVVKKFAPTQTYEKWVESLRMTDSSMAGQTLTAPPSPRVDKSVTNEPFDQYEYTTKVLSRLPNKPTIKKVTIYGELGRPDVRKQERELIGRVLHDIPGESVDSNLFQERVLGEVTPLNLKVTSTYAGYGLSNIGVKVVSDMGDSQGRAVPETHIWEGKGIGFSSPHFRESDSYWAHSRGFTEVEPYEVRGDNTQPKSWNIIELQSDMEQHGELDMDERFEMQSQIEDADGVMSLASAFTQAVGKNDVEGINSILYGDGSVHAGVMRSAISNQLGTETVLAMDRFTTALKMNAVQNARIEKQVVLDDLKNASERAQLRKREAEAALKGGDPASKNMPDKWWELILRHETTWAGRRGFQTVRMATAPTVMKVENWPTDVHNENMPEDLKRDLQAFRFQSPLAETGVLVGTGDIFMDNAGMGGETPLVIVMRDQSFTQQDIQGGRGHTEWVKVTDEHVPPELRKRVEAFYNANHGINEDYAGLYRRYEKDITKFVQREFAAKPYTDSQGNAWLEWPTNMDLADMPIVYYNTVKATEETGGEIARKSGVPELPETFQRFQGFLQSTLQLNQMAKILPDVVGLQRYRTAMRSLHALKAKLFEGPNDRIHDWHKLGRIQAKRVEQALRDEQLSGEHWTALMQTDVDGKPSWVHVPTAGFDKLMRDKGITQEGQELFLGVKNDYLSTLTAMEEVVKRHTSAFFEKNETVLAFRLAHINEEFTKLRGTPYLPDMRFGQYSVQVRAGRPEVVEGREIKSGELVYWEKFESERARNKRLAELKRSLPGHTVSASYDSELVSTMRGLPQSVMDAVAETLNSDPATALTAEQKVALEQIAFDQTAAGKFAKYLGTPAKHIAGSSKDMRRAYAAYHWKTANAIAKLNYFRALTGAMNAVRADARAVRTAGGTSDPHDKLAEYMQNNFTFVMNPTHEFEQLRAFVSLWYLWGSAKTAAMNLTSVPVLTFPYLWARFGNLQAQASLLRAIKDVTLYWRDPTKVSADRQRVLEQLKADGVTDQSFASMLASVSDGGVAFEKVIPSWEGSGTGEAVDIARRMAWKITSMGMMPFRVIEQFNRQITGLAAYDLMVGKTGKTLSGGDTEAYNFARDAVDYTQNEYGAWNRPPMMQGKQSIFLLFFSFVQNMSFLMFGGDKSWWRAMLVLGAMAGIQGLPGMDNLIDMFNWGARKLSGQHVDLRNEARAVARELGMNPDMVMHGISHNWLGLGWDTSTSVGAGRIIPGTDAIFGVGKFEDRFLHATSEVGGPVGSLMLSFLQALADDNPSELLRWDRALPPVLRNIEKTYRAVTEDAWTNAGGRTLAPDPTGAELVGQSLGFSPTRRTERSEELRAVKDIVEFYKERRTNLMEMMWSAKRAHDPEVVGEVRSAITAFNAGVPSSHLRITPEDVAASMKSRAKLDRETAAMKSPQARYRDIYRYIDELY